MDDAMGEMDGEMDEMDGSMDHSSMNMGDPDATRAEEVDGADLLTGAFELLETRPQGYDDLSGVAAIARHEGGTTVTIELEGLEANVEYIAHVHVGPCSTDSDHYMFDLEGSTMPPNEVHLAFTSGGSGSGFMTAENDQVVGDDGQSLIVHRADLLDNKIACAPFG